MQLLVIFIAFVAFSAGYPKPEVPGDNSNYVKGKSRYIWIPDGNDVPQLVDLSEKPSDEEFNQASRNGVDNDNEYYLYTRINPTTPQIISYGNLDSIWDSNYNRHLSLKVIVHGWMSDGNSSINPKLTDAFLSDSNCNVIVVDWKSDAKSLYWTSVRRVPDVGRHLGQFLTWLIESTRGKWSRVHLVGFSLGAHVVGNAGRTVNGRVARITGLDPAGPIFDGSPDALRADDAQYVEVIHTDGGMLGIFDPIGQANFYPNGGRSQAGCWLSTCSHSRSYDLFAASVYYDHFIGQSCDSLIDARKQRCSGNKLFKMGNSDLSKRGHGIFGLSTSRSWPY